MRVLPVAAIAFVVGCASSPKTCPESPATQTVGSNEPAAVASAQPVAAPTPEQPPYAGKFDARLSQYAYPHEVKERRFAAQDQQLEMAYMDVQPTGKPNGRAVLLLHGKNFSGAYWETTIRALTGDGFRVVVPDQIGFGKSSKPASFQYTFHALATHTRDLLADLGIEKVTVVGHSMGGMVATRFALMYPDRAEKLVLVNPIGLEDWQQFVGYVPVSQWFENELKKTPDQVRAYMKTAYFDGKWKTEYDGLAELQMGWTQSPDYRQIAWASALTYDMIYTQPVVHDFPRVKQPTLLIIGDRDRTALGRGSAPAEVAAKMGLYTKLGTKTRDAIPNAKLVTLAGIGHIPQYEAFDDYMKALKSFLAK